MDRHRNSANLNPEIALGGVVECVGKTEECIPWQDIKVITKTFEPKEKDNVPWWHRFDRKKWRR